MRVPKNKEFLKLLLKTHTSQRESLLKTANVEQVLALTELLFTTWLKDQKLDKNSMKVLVEVYSERVTIIMELFQYALNHVQNTGE